MPTAASNNPLAEKFPPGRWYLFLLPLLLALAALTIAQTAGRAGQRFSRELDQTKLDLKRADLAARLAQAHQRGDTALALELEDQLRAAIRQTILSYRLPGRHFTNWDGYRYEQIIEDGYVADFVQDPRTGERRIPNVVWYPLYPLLGTAVQKISGWFLPEPLEAYQALALVSTTCALLAALVIFALARRHFQTHLPAAPAPSLETGHWILDTRPTLNTPSTAALWAVAFLVFSPTAVFLFANYTESLFVLLLALFLLCLQRRLWWTAALVAAVAASSRSQGVLFGPVLALVYLLRAAPPFRLSRIASRLPTAFALAAISSLGLLGYMLYLQLHFHNPLAFMEAQHHWRVGLNADTLAYSLNPLHGLNNFLFYLRRQPLDLPRLWEAICVIAPPVLLLLGARFLSFEQNLLGWILWALPYISNSLAPSDVEHGHLHWMSMGRFLGVAIPLQIILAGFILRFRWLGPFLLALSASAFALFSYWFGGGQWLG